MWHLVALGGSYRNSTLKKINYVLIPKLLLIDMTKGSKQI